MIVQTQPAPLNGSGKRSVIELARLWQQQGLQPIPIKTDGPKEPVGKWEDFKDPTKRKGLGYFKEKGIAIVCGNASGKLEVIDFDDARFYPEWCELVEKLAPGLLQRLLVVNSPRPGYHVYYRCSVIGNHENLARELQTDDEGKRKVKVTIEVRAEGNYIIAPGSPDECHPLKRPYTVASGEPPERLGELLTTITPEEREILLSCARSLNLYVEEVTHGEKDTPTCRGVKGVSPGDQFADATSWEAILAPHGWKPDGTNKWTRPGKDRGTSASTVCISKYGRELLKVFSSNAHPFAADATYTKFAAYTILNHQGDYKAATKDLVKQGFGEKRKPSGNHSNKIEIDAAGEDHSTIRKAAELALAETGLVYQLGGKIVHVVQDPPAPRKIKQPADVKRIVPVDRWYLNELMGEAAYWYLDTPEGQKKVHPKQDFTLKLLGCGQWPTIPRITGIVHTPVLLDDGTLIDRPGYDPDTGLFLDLPGSFPPIAETPTLDDAIRARDELLEVFCDFPFEKPEHLAAGVSCVLTLLGRQAFDGCVPAIAVDSNTAGTGKNLFINANAMIATSDCAASSNLPQGDEELRKLITSTLMAGFPIFHIDNVETDLGGSALDGVLTCRSWVDRKLGKSEMTAPLPAKTVWFASGNNLVMKGDMLRRALHVRLESDLEKPEERDGFRHTDLLGWVRDNRSRLVAAALTMLRAYIRAGRPDMKLPKWGSFEQWSDLIRNTVVWCGLADPGETRETFRKQADSKLDAMQLLLAGWREGEAGKYGMTVPEAMDHAETATLGGAGERYATLRAALESIGWPRVSGRAIARTLMRAKGRWIGNMALKKTDVVRKNNAVWTVVVKG